MSLIRLLCAAALAALVLPTVATAGTSAVLTHYLALHDALASDRLEGCADHVAQLAAAAVDADGLEAVAKDAAGLDSSSLEALRSGFNALSIAVADAVTAGSLNGADLYYCPMAKGYWLQATADDGVRNPYYGASMLRCGGPAKAIADDARG
jgi:hypothetical protein